MKNYLKKTEEHPQTTETEEVTQEITTPISIVMLISMRMISEQKSNDSIKQGDQLLDIDNNLE